MPSFFFFDRKANRIFNYRKSWKFFYVIFRNDDFIYKFRIDLNSLFGKLKFFKFGFKLNFTIVFKILMAHLVDGNKKW